MIIIYTNNLKNTRILWDFYGIVYWHLVVGCVLFSVFGWYVILYVFGFCPAHVNECEVSGGGGREGMSMGISGNTLLHHGFPWGFALTDASISVLHSNMTNRHVEMLLEKNLIFLQKIMSK